MPDWLVTVAVVILLGQLIATGLVIAWILTQMGREEVVYFAGDETEDSW